MSKLNDELMAFLFNPANIWIVREQGLKAKLSTVKLMANDAGHQPSQTA